VEARAKMADVTGSLARSGGVCASIVERFLCALYPSGGESGDFKSEAWSSLEVESEGLPRRFFCREKITRSTG